MTSSDHVQADLGQSARRLAGISDDQLVPDVRAAVVALGYWFDAWWPAVRHTATKIQQQRADLIEAARAQVASLGAAATLPQLAEITQPLLGDYFDTNEINSAVDLIRDVTMHRWPHIKRAREDVARWDAQNVTTFLGRA